MLVDVRRTALRLIPAFVLLFAVMVGIGLLVTKVLPGTSLGDLDTRIPKDLVGRREGGDVPESFLISEMSATPTIVGLCIVAAVACRLVFHRWRDGIFVVVSVIGETSIFTLTTLVIKRNRPDVARLDESPPTSSFPSGHSAAAVAFYGSIAALVIWHTRRTWLRWLAGILAVVIPLSIGSARVYRGMHFPTDVLSGLFLGACWLAVMVRFVLTEHSHHQRAHEHERPDPLPATS